MVEIENHETLIITFLTFDSNAWSTLVDDIGVIDPDVYGVILHANEVITDRGRLVNVEHAPSGGIWSLTSIGQSLSPLWATGLTVKKSNMPRNCAGL